MHAKKYVVEMFIDRIAASKIYMKEMYDDGQPLAYYQRGLPYTILHKDSKALLETLLYMLAEKGENATFSYIEKESFKTIKESSRWELLFSPDNRVDFFDI